MLNEISNTELERLLERHLKLQHALEFEYSDYGAASLRVRLGDVTERIGSELEHVRLTSDTELGNLLEDIKQGPACVPAATLGSWIRVCGVVEEVRQEWWMFLAEHEMS